MSAFFILLTLAIPVNAKTGIYVKPLIQTKWGMRRDFAKYSPKNRRLGCWSVAFAQILYYHKLQPKGFVKYSGKDFQVNANLNYKFKWQLFKNKLTKNTAQKIKDEVGKYSFFVAAAIGKKFSQKGGYTGNSDVRRRRLRKYFSCNSKRIRNDRHGNNAVRNLIKYELLENRPLLMYFEAKKRDKNGSRIAHAVVVDGMRSWYGDLQVHLNFGWYGKDDGWYSLFKPIVTRHFNFDHPDRWVLAIWPKGNGPRYIKKEIFK